MAEVPQNPDHPATGVQNPAQAINSIQLESFKRRGFESPEVWPKGACRLVPVIKGSATKAVICGYLICKALLV